MFGHKEKILTIGAYERDNFGDLLFYLVLEWYFKNKYTLTPGSIIDADMSSLLGHEVVSYARLLQERDWSTIWVVGGEIGGVTVDTALIMDYGNGDASKKFREDAEQNLGDAATIAYLPDKSRIKGGTKLILNSVGLSSLMIVGEDIRERAIATLRSASYIAVRDIKSLYVLDNLGIEAELKPDVVHSISRLIPHPKKIKSLPERYVLVQISESIINETGIESVAESLDRLSTVSSSPIVFFVAGTTFGHDSRDLYKKVANKMKSTTQILEERRPDRLAAAIYHADMWLGSSLHGRIIASSYAVPRVSIEKQKVSEYASCWDRHQPYGVSVSKLDSAYRQAKGVSKEVLKNESDRLSGLAIKNLEFIENKVLLGHQKRK